MILVQCVERPDAELTYSAGELGGKSAWSDCRVALHPSTSR